MEDFICSFNIPSIPGDLFCFRVLNALSISSSDISLFIVSFTYSVVFVFKLHSEAFASSLLIFKKKTHINLVLELIILSFSYRHLVCAKIPLYLSFYTYEAFLFFHFYTYLCFHILYFYICFTYCFKQSFIIFSFMNIVEFSDFII